MLVFVLLSCSFHHFLWDVAFFFFCIELFEVVRLVCFGGLEVGRQRELRKRQQVPSSEAMAQT